MSAKVVNASSVLFGLSH